MAGGLGSRGVGVEVEDRLIVGVVADDDGGASGSWTVEGSGVGAGMAGDDV